MEFDIEELRKVAVSGSKYSEMAEHLLTIEEMVKRYRKARGFDRARARIDIFEGVSDLAKSFRGSAERRPLRTIHCAG